MQGHILSTYLEEWIFLTTAHLFCKPEHNVNHTLKTPFLEELFVCHFHLIDRISQPQEDIHALLHATCEYATLHSKKDFQT